MNMQAMLKQAQQLQKEMTKAKDEINNTLYTGESSFVKVEMNGNKELKQVKLSVDSLDKDDIEMLEDLFVVAINEAMKKINKDTEDKLGKYTKGMPGLF